MIVWFVGKWVGVDDYSSRKFVAVYEKRRSYKILQENKPKYDCYDLPLIHFLFIRTIVPLWSATRYPLSSMVAGCSPIMMLPSLSMTH